jgi:hypothetical protein
MKFNQSTRVLKSLLAACTLAVITTGCGNTASLPSATLNSSSLTTAATDDLNAATLQEFFSVLADGNTTATKSSAQPADLKKRWDNFKSKNPDMAAKMEALKNLTPEERKAKLQALHSQGQRPAFAQGQRPAFGPGHAPGQRPDFAADHPPMSAEMAAQMEALKNLTPEERKAKMQEFGKKVAEQFKADHPDMAAKMDGFKNMTPEERKAQMDAFQKAHPDMKGPQGKPAAGAPFHKGFPGAFGPRKAAAQK